MERRQNRIRGFTLLELVLVLVLLSTILALGAPSLRGFWASSRSRDAATQLLSLTQWARARSASDALVHRLNINTVDGSYWLTVHDGEEFVALGTDFGRVFSLPEGMFVEVVRGLSVASAAPGAVSQAGDWIDFHPDGRSDVASIHLRDGRGEVTVIACLSPAEPFRILSREEVGWR